MRVLTPITPPRRWGQAAALLLLAACAPADKAADTGEPGCNGHVALCDLPFDQVALPATHNSMSNDADGWLFPNQPDGVEAQLEAGVRGLLLDTYDLDGEAVLCHSECDWGSRPLVEVLGAINTFLDEHPSEVMAIIFQDALSPEATAAVFAEVGLDARVLTVDPGWEPGGWPTLGELVEADTRLLVTAESEGPPPDWYYHAWDLYYDTPYTFDSLDDFNCDLNRGAADNPLFLVNHWLGPIPTASLGASANAWDVLYDRVVRCQSETGHTPNLVAVDWYSEGELFAVTDAINGVADPSPAR